MENIGIHILTAYPPSNPNRDDNGSPKSAVVGGVTRQRISSQCIKRAWRLSAFMAGFDKSTRTRKIGDVFKQILTDRDISEEKAVRWALLVANVFGSAKENKPKTAAIEVLKENDVEDKDANSWATEIANAYKAVGGKKGKNTEEVSMETKVGAVKNVLVNHDIREELAASMAAKIIVLVSSLQTKETVVLGHEEIHAVERLAEKLASEDRGPTSGELEDLKKPTASVDVALFGRMRAGSEDLKVDASVYVSHPLTTGKSTVENDFWTAVDDRKGADSDAGSAGMGDVEFGAGTFYTYIQVNHDGLAKNLRLDGKSEHESRELSNQVILKLIEAVSQVTPSAHKTTFGNQVRASYVRVEVGAPSGNLFCKAYEIPTSVTHEAIKRLQVAAAEEASAYGLEQRVFEFRPPQSLAEMLSGVSDALKSPVAEG
ncbi:type I-E CRISPR-associated protein Cas7/Cse4/CasC [Ferrovum sp.]|uniref:type I-E CRISPR-associated protein Cas7/Cse4/CasC n=1 Tax=Ferrovum sp. TaxID=2609467 RepID=UPI00261C61B7|nr:type I-E CRISPR-associated protein Cas7/Cse4/CasC [Ferrovum sp.]